MGTPTIFWPICDLGTMISFWTTCYVHLQEMNANISLCLWLPWCWEIKDSLPPQPNLLLLQPLLRLLIIMFTPTCACKLLNDSIGLLWLVIILIIAFAHDFTRLLACEFAPICEWICKLWKTIAKFYESIVVDLLCDEAWK